MKEICQDENYQSGLLYKISDLNWMRLFFLFPLLYLLSTLGLSLIKLFRLAFWNETGFTLQYIERVFATPVYCKVLVNTLSTALLVTVISVALAYPVAYLATTSEKPVIRSIINTTIMMTFCTSILVRNFALIVILQNNGVVNSILLELGLIDTPVKLVYNSIGVIIGLVASLIPYAYLSLTAVMEKINPNLCLASQGLGANPLTSFIRVFLPLSKMGIYSGALMVFVLSIGFYITPTLLGGADSTMISVLIQDNIDRTLNWNLAAAISLILFIVTSILIIVLFRVTGFSFITVDIEKEVHRLN